MYFFSIGHGIHSYQTWYSPSDMVPTIKPGTPLSHQTLYPHGPSNLSAIGPGTPIGPCTPPLAFRMISPSHEVVLFSCVHWMRSTCFFCWEILTCFYIVYYTEIGENSKIKYTSGQIMQKAYHLSVSIFSIGHGIHSHQTWYSPSDMVPTIKPSTSLSNQTLYPWT